jgi:hypothetical protein
LRRVFTEYSEVIVKTRGLPSLTKVRFGRHYDLRAVVAPFEGGRTLALVITHIFFGLA